MHPGDDADAASTWSASRSIPAIASGVDTTGFGTMRTGAPALVEARGDHAGIRGDALEDLGPVEVLATGDEPDLAVRHHGDPIDERPPGDGR